MNAWTISLAAVVVAVGTYLGLNLLFPHEQARVQAHGNDAAVTAVFGESAAPADAGENP